MFPEQRLSLVPCRQLCAQRIEEAEFRIALQPPERVALSLFSRLASILASFVDEENNTPQKPER